MKSSSSTYLLVYILWLWAQFLCINTLAQKYHKLILIKLYLDEMDIHGIYSEQSWERVCVRAIIVIGRTMYLFIFWLGQ